MSACSGVGVGYTCDVTRRDDVMMSRDLQVSAQDCWTGGNGAYTGETSADMLKDMGVGWCIIGHSERRQKVSQYLDVIQKTYIPIDSYNTCSRPRTIQQW